MTKNIESPRTLTGGQAVHQDIPLKSLVDWVQVTFKGKKTLAEILWILGLSKVEFTVFPRGYYGYPNMIGMGNISIMYLDCETEWHIQMTGQGCRMFEQVSEKTWIELFSYIHADEDANMTRLDLAIDDFKGIFSIPTIRRKMIRGELVTKFNQGDERSKFKFASDIIGNSPVTGDGVQFGSPTSRLLIRMYDKLKERQGQGFEVTCDKWIRTELQIRKEYANDAVRDLVESGFALGEVARGYLKEYLRFVDPGSDSNKRRWKVSNFWKIYMKNIEPLKLSLAAPDKTIAKTIGWLDHAIAPSLAMIYQAKGEPFFNRFVEEMRVQGKDRMRKSHEAMVNEYVENGKIQREINKMKMNEVKRKMATIRKNRSQQQNEKYNRLVLKKYSMNTGVSPEFDNTSVLDKPVPRIRFLYE